MLKIDRLLCCLAPVLALVACGDSDGSGGAGGSAQGGAGEGGALEVTLPDAEAATFVAGTAIDNPYFPLPVGATWVYEAVTDEGVERIEVEVLAETRRIEGVVATVVQDTAYLDDVLIEDTFDWYAQDADGNVWYLGEDTCEYTAGECTNTVGSWEWGVAGALPGIIMRATPTIDGEAYYQEYLAGTAEDAGEVIEVGVSITVPAGSFGDCITTRDFSTLDAELDEKKTYCPGVGNVFVEEADTNEELLETTGL